MPIVRNTKGHEQIHVSNLSEATIHVDGLETLQTDANASLSSIDTKIPAALTGSGNLKVCIQELGNEGSERLNVDVGTAIVQLPTAVTGNGNLKIAIQEDFSKRSAEVSIVSSVGVGAITQIGSDINIGTAKSIIIYGTATGNLNFNLEHSSNGSAWFLHSNVAPTAHGGVYHYNVKVEDGLQYYRLINTSSNTFTLNYVKI
tara:strand:- start:199 stop:804 length:606 start_codon:yes stop_codon:yes gene_type:complete